MTSKWKRRKSRNKAVAELAPALEEAALSQR
jgi:hypothetical protein